MKNCVYWQRLSRGHVGISLESLWFLMQGYLRIRDFSQFSESLMILWGVEGQISKFLAIMCWNAVLKLLDYMPTQFTQSIEPPPILACEGLSPFRILLSYSSYFTSLPVESGVSEHSATFPVFCCSCPSLNQYSEKAHFKKKSMIRMSCNIKCIVLVVHSM